MADVRRLPVEGHDAVAVTLDELAREGACRMIAMALEVEVVDYLARFQEGRHGDGLQAARRRQRALAQVQRPI